MVEWNIGRFRHYGVTDIYIICITFRMCYSTTWATGDG